MFLEPDELIALTGWRRKSSQIAQLKKMGIPFFVNASGHPVVACTAIEGQKAKAEPKKWVPSWAENRV